MPRPTGFAGLEALLEGVGLAGGERTRCLGAGPPAKAEVKGEVLAPKEGEGPRKGEVGTSGEAAG